MPSEASFDISGYPSIRITIYNWNDLSIPDRNQIRSQFVSIGYSEHDVE